jgi:hypothetical protein
MPRQTAPPSAATPGTTGDSRPVLDDAEAHRRLLLLADLQSSLADLGIASTLARNHRLVLRYTDGIAGPNGLTDPELHIFGPAQIRIATTDGTTLRLGSTREYPAADPVVAAAHIARELEPASAAALPQ